MQNNSRRFFVKQLSDYRIQFHDILNYMDEIYKDSEYTFYQVEKGVKWKMDENFNGDIEGLYIPKDIDLALNYILK